MADHLLDRRYPVSGVPALDSLRLQLDGTQGTAPCAWQNRRQPGDCRVDPGDHPGARWTNHLGRPLQRHHPGHRPSVHRHGAVEGPNPPHESVSTTLKPPTRVPGAVDWTEKYRPHSLAELVGNGPAVRALRERVPAFNSAPKFRGCLRSDAAASLLLRPAAHIRMCFVHARVASRSQWVWGGGDGPVRGGSSYAVRLLSGLLQFPIDRREGGVGNYIAQRFYPLALNTVCDIRFAEGRLLREAAIYRLVPRGLPLP